MLPEWSRTFTERLFRRPNVVERSNLDVPNGQNSMLTNRTAILKTQFLNNSTLQSICIEKIRLLKILSIKLCFILWYLCRCLRFTFDRTFDGTFLILSIFYSKPNISCEFLPKLAPKKFIFVFYLFLALHSPVNNDNFWIS